MLFDTHCHLDLPALAGELDQQLDEARSAGITRWVVPGLSAGGWGGIAALCARVSGAMPAFGIHPAYAATAGDRDLDLLEQFSVKAVAIGEVGLDCKADDLSRQEGLLREQVRLARRQGLPLLIHCRGAIGQLIRILREEHASSVGGIMHSFSGSVESALECIKLGFAVSLSGTLTWTGAKRPWQLASSLPLGSIVVESDAPDLAPQRYRGRTNRPAWLVETATRLADIRNVPYDELATILAANSYRALRLDPARSLR